MSEVNYAGVKVEKRLFNYTTIFGGMGFFIYGLVAIAIGENLCQVWNILNRIFAVIIAAVMGDIFSFRYYLQLCLPYIL